MPRKGSSKYGKELLTEVVEQARSYKEALVKLGLTPNNGNYRFIAAKVKMYGLSVEHFVGHATRGRSAENDELVRKITDQLRWSDDEVFQEHPPVWMGGSKLRPRLLKKGREYRCTECGLEPFWNGRSLTLQVDHINGDSTDNRLDNLRFLCPNCHAQTSTFGNHPQQREKPKCACGAAVFKKGNRCSHCANEETGRRKRGQNTKILWPPLDELRQMVEHTSYLAVARILGVSDNAVRKHLKTMSEV